MPYLQFSDDRTVPVEGDNFVLGADPVCDLTLEGEDVAARHAILQFDDDVWRLATLSLHSETLLNGEPVESIIALEEGDALKLGNVTLRWLEREPISAKRFPVWVPVVLVLFICLTGLGLWAVIRQFSASDLTPTATVVGQTAEEAVQVGDADVTEGKSTEATTDTAATGDTETIEQEAESTPVQVKAPAPTAAELEAAATEAETQSETAAEPEAEAACPHPEGWVQMTVGQDQKLRDIARKAGTQPKIIQNANCLPNTKVKAGIVLWVPLWEGAEPVEVAETTEETAATATETGAETSEATAEAATTESSDATETQEATASEEVTETAASTAAGETAATPAEAEKTVETAEAETACPAPDGWVQVTVAPGQKVKDIAKAAGTTPRKIKDANCLPHYKIETGDVLWVPQPAEAERESAASSEVVEAIEEAVETAKTTAAAVVAELAGAEDASAEAENACPAPDGWVQVTVETGQKVKDIARAAGTTPRVLKDANCLPNYKIEAGDTLWVPPAAGEAQPETAGTTEPEAVAETAEAEDVCSIPDGWVQVEVEAGMKLKDIAKVVGSKARVIKEGNCLPNYKINPGQLIWVPALQAALEKEADATEIDVTSCPYPENWVQMTVQKGQKLRDIAHKIGVQPWEIKVANCLPDTKVKAGMILWVPRWDGKG